MGTARITASLLAALSVAACGAQGSPTAPAPSRPPASSSVTHVVVDPQDELVARGILMQDSPTSPVELCLGGVAESYPPQCGGPALVGDVDWDALRPERANGVTWTGEVWVVGRYDPDKGSSGEVTPTRPVALTPPPGMPTPPASTPEFPQLCDDPYAGGGRRGAGSFEEQARLTEAMEHLEGYAGSWVSDGSSLFNVIVTGDAAAAHATLREVWPGGLCVEQRDAPTEAQLRAAQEALGDSSGTLGLLGSGGGPADGLLHVQVTLLDRATLDAILAAVRPWLTPEQVAVTSAFQPLPS